MKRIALVTSVVLVAIVSVACKQNKPEPVVEKYFTHFYRAEFEAIQNYVTEEHRSYYEILRQLTAESVEVQPQVKVSDIKCEIQSDTVAVCSCLVAVDAEGMEGMSTEQTVQLKKVNKTWLVNQGKEGGNMFAPTIEEATEDEVSAVITEEE